MSKIKLTGTQIENWVSNNFRYKRASRGRQLVICNPFDGDDDFHFWISTEETALKQGPRKGHKGFWVHDFRPGRKEYQSSFFKFVSRYRNISYQQAVAEVTGLSSTDIKLALRETKRATQKKEEEEKEDVEVVLPSCTKPLKDDKSRMADVVRHYLSTRLVDQERIEKHNLHYSPGTILFPYYEFGVLVFWQEREIMNKRFNFPDESKTGLSKTDYLYNFDNVEIPGSPVIVVESIFNAISLFENTVATGGATIAGRQPKKLQMLDPAYVILAPDNDEAGIKSLKDNYFLLKDKFKLAYSLPPPNLDWNDYEQQNRKGSAAIYLSQHTSWLTLPVLMKLSA